MTVTKIKKYSLFSVYDLHSVRLLTRLRLQLSHLNQWKFRYCFGVTVSHICGGNAEIGRYWTLSLAFYSDIGALQ